MKGTIARLDYQARTWAHRVTLVLRALIYAGLTLTALALLAVFALAFILH